MAKFNELNYLDATAQAELVRKREVTAAELVEAAIERIERLNPEINAVVTPMYEEAHATVAGQVPDGPFSGVPFLLKDLAAYSGVRMTSGSTLLRDFVPNVDSELVARLRRAGLIVVGKTNLSEFALTPTTEPQLFGPTHNPWDTSRTPGGSSGGSAAAVAAGLVPMAHGNDGGGSIRIPASCSGVFGLKPTRGRNPLPLAAVDFTVDHALTRSVRDSAALLDATSGPDIGEPYWAAQPERPFIQEVGASVGKLRIAFTAKAATGVPVNADCVNAVNDAATLCADLGHEVVEAAPMIPGDLAAQWFVVLWSSLCATVMDTIALQSGRTLSPDDVEPITWGLYEMGREHSASAYLRSVTALRMVSREIGRFFLDYDIWLTPTLAEPPVLLGTFDSPPGNPMQGFDRMVGFVPFTWIFNAAGQPAMSVPLFWNAEGLPIGTHFAGRFADEATLFRLAAQLEQARPWAGRRPPVSA